MRFGPFAFKNNPMWEEKMPKVEIELKNLKEAHKNGCSDVKKTLEAMFPDQFKKKGRLKEGQTYYYVQASGWVSSYEDCGDLHDNLFEFGNYFHTKEQAEQVLNGASNAWSGLSFPGPLSKPAGSGLKTFFKARQRHYKIID